MSSNSARIDKTKLDSVEMSDPDDSVAYWRSRTVAEKLEALQLLRETFYGPAATARLRRVLKSADQA